MSDAEKKDPMNESLVKNPEVCARGGGGLSFPSAKTIVRYAALGFSLLAIAMMVTVSVFAFIDPSPSDPMFQALSPVYARGTNFAFAGVFVVAMLSVFADQDLFDFYTAAVALLPALVGVGLIMVYEIWRWSTCGSVGPAPFDFEICSNYPDQNWIMPVFSGGIFVCLLFSGLCLGIWFSMQMQKSTSYAKVKQHFKAISANMPGRLLSIVAVVQIAVLLVVCVWSWIEINSDAFYRGIFIVVQAHFIGAEVAFFGYTPKSWNVITLVFLVLALFFLVFGSIYEFPRFWNCYVSGGSDTTRNNLICFDHYNSGWVIPIAIAIFMVLDVISLVLVIWRFLTSDDPAEVEKSNVD